MNIDGNMDVRCGCHADESPCCLGKQAGAHAFTTVPPLAPTVYRAASTFRTISVPCC